MMANRVADVENMCRMLFNMLIPGCAKKSGGSVGGGNAACPRCSPPWGETFSIQMYLGKLFSSDKTNKNPMADKELPLPSAWKLGECWPSLSFLSQHTQENNLPAGPEMAFDAVGWWTHAAPPPWPDSKYAYQLIQYWDIWCQHSFKVKQHSSWFRVFLR